MTLLIKPCYFPPVSYFQAMGVGGKFIFWDTLVYKDSNRTVTKHGELAIPVTGEGTIRDIEVVGGGWALEHAHSLVDSYGKKAKNHRFYELLVYCHEYYIFGDRKLMDYLYLTTVGVAEYLGIRDRMFRQEKQFRRFSEVDDSSELEYLEWEDGGISILDYCVGEGLTKLP